MLNLFDFLNSINKSNRKAAAALFYLTAGVVYFILFKNIIFSILLVFFTWFLVSEVIFAVQERRKEIIASQLAALAANMVIMLRSGHAIRQIINQSVLWAKQPLKKYLKNLSDELDTGIAFDPAMDNFSARCASKDASLITSALKINNRIGGNLIFVLDKITETLQENYKVKSNAKTLTLQARLSGNIIAAMPVAALSVMFLSMSSSISIFFQSRLGNIFLILGSVLEIAGILVIRKLLKTNL